MCISLILLYSLYHLMMQRMTMSKRLSRSHFVRLGVCHGIVRKPDFCLCGNKGADQLRSNCEADQRLCFRYTDSTLSLYFFYIPKFQASACFCDCTGRFVSDLVGNPASRLMNQRERERSETCVGPVSALSNENARQSEVFPFYNKKSASC